MENAKASQSNDWLNTYAQKWKIFIDTCSLLTDSIDMFWSNILPHLNQYNSKVIIPYRCIQELEKFIKTHFAAFFGGFNFILPLRLCRCKAGGRRKN